MSTSEVLSPRAAESAFFEHIEAALADGRLVLPTRDGLLAVDKTSAKVVTRDSADEVHRLVAAAHVDEPRALRDRLPIGRRIEATFKRRRWLFKRPVARLEVISAAPIEALIAVQATGDVPKLSASDIAKYQSTATRREPHALVLFAPQGFDDSATKRGSGSCRSPRGPRRPRPRRRLGNRRRIRLGHEPRAIRPPKTIPPSESVLKGPSPICGPMCSPAAYRPRRLPGGRISRCNGSSGSYNP